MSEDSVIVKPRRKKLPTSGQQIIILSLFKQCQVDACPIHEYCDHSQYGYCGFEKEYIENMLGPYIAVLDKNPNPYYIMVFGQQIVPLYLDLARLMIVERGLKKTETSDHKGNKKIHPVYSQKSNLMMAINQIMKTSGFLRFMESNNSLGLKSGGSSGEEGDRNLHDILMDSEE